MCVSYTNELKTNPIQKYIYLQAWGWGIQTWLNT
jgi:hypothetical protein